MKDKEVLFQLLFEPFIMTLLLICFILGLILIIILYNKQNYKGYRKVGYENFCEECKQKKECYEFHGIPTCKECIKKLKR